MHPVLASAAGSELPWFTPIVISLLLVLVSGIYRSRHRPRGNGGDPGGAGFPGDAGGPERASSRHRHDGPFPLLLSRLRP